MKRSDLIKYLGVGLGAIYAYHKIKDKPDKLGEVVVIINKADQFRQRLNSQRPPMKDLN